MAAYLLERGLANGLERIANLSHRQGGSYFGALMAKKVPIVTVMLSLLNLSVTRLSVLSLSVLSLSLLSLLVPQSAMASSSTVPISMAEMKQAGLIFESEQGELTIALPMKTDVSMHVSGWVNRVSVRHEFKNMSSEWVNGQYLFPLPNEAAVDQLKLHIGARVIEGQIQPKAKAKAIYEQAKVEGKKASLLEQKRANIFSAQVANLAPNEMLIVELTYQETLDYKDGAFSLRFPMVIAPRYAPRQEADSYNKLNKPQALSQQIINGTKLNYKQSNELIDINKSVYAHSAVVKAEDEALESEALESRERQNRVSMTVTFDAAMPIENIVSPYHGISINMVENAAAQVSLDNYAVANRDFVLTWQPVQGSEPTAAVFSQQGKTHAELASQVTAGDTSFNQGGAKSKLSPQSQPEPQSQLQVQDSKQQTLSKKALEKYALVMLMPPQGSDDESSSIARELVLVIDTSGSMSGDAIIQAKSALKYALAGLRPQDSFNVLQFNSTVERWSRHVMPATAINLGRAQNYINGLQADGGTEMSLALDAALTKLDNDRGHNSKPVHDDDRYQSSNETLEQSAATPLRQVLFITDGAVANESRLFEQIKNQLGESRLFTIGIGSAPNAHFMQRAAEVGRGTYTYIGKLDEVNQKVVSLLEKIEKPQVTDVELHFSDGSVPDYWPVRIPDLYAHEPVLVALRIPSYVSDDLLIQGQLAGQFWQRRLPLNSAAQVNDLEQAKGLDLIWARKQIAALELSKQTANKERIEKQITAIAMKFHIMSAYTSLVAVDVTPVKPTSIAAKEARVIQHLPSGWQRLSQTLPQTGTNSFVFMIFGTTLLLLAALYRLSFRRTDISEPSCG
ncbi:LPXTG-motif cell wall anchor domain [Shewanella halifaxensis HAW-EB4]|uniref:LPXTG-motif cell wall anchor domain n=1 Tax=Shewanella halifaxensis (strain HAW-EB4) TaxID=458817 RepID=B0TQ23_SHEHH|nr:marine proteobacterial sortase target protein [Shewanella halifaxensis]ABZ76302.1 LPXTG-motif cell wall anchor domain [Shewanella halifaxensis HAW-EB4]